VTDRTGAVDTTGAGDAFAASVVAGLGEAWPANADRMRTVITDALSLASQVVRVAGAQGRVADEGAVASR
jgi:sugar/nucleoside kinase (ribokinase family)